MAFSLLICALSGRLGGGSGDGQGHGERGHRERVFEMDKSYGTTVCEAGKPVGTLR